MTFLLGFTGQKIYLTIEKSGIESWRHTFHFNTMEMNTIYGLFFHSACKNGQGKLAEKFIILKILLIVKLWVGFAYCEMQQQDVDCFFR